MSVRIRRAGALAVIAAVLVAGQAAAADKATERRWAAACRGDAFKLCTLSALSGRRQAVADCLERNFARLSTKCRGVIEEARDKGIQTAGDGPVE